MSESDPDHGDTRIVYDGDRERLVKEKWERNPIADWRYRDAMVVEDADLSALENSPWRADHDE